MAKKRSMNVFELYIDKLLLSLAVVVFVWIIYSKFLTPPTIDVGMQSLAPSKAAQQAAETANTAVSTVQTPRPVDLPAPPDLMQYAQPPTLAPSIVDDIPLSPMYVMDDASKTQRRNYVPPTIPELAQVNVDLTHAQAYVPIETTEQGGDMARTNQRQEYAEQDVDFVTIEAKLPIKDVRESFARSFTDSSLDQPLEIGEPVVAVVELQRSRLDENGIWQDYESVPYFNPNAGSDDKGPLTVADINSQSQTLYEVSFLDRLEEYNSQLSLLKPLPYDLVSQQWLPPSLQKQQSEEEKQLEQDRRREEAESRRNVNRQPRGGAAAGGPGPGGDMGMMPGMGAPGMEMPGAMPGMQPQQRRTTSTPRRRSYNTDAILQADLFNDDQVLMWAHDYSLELGQVYRYRIRVGFFNPIAGKDWFDDDYRDYDQQRILWTPWAQPEKFVRAPKRTYYFPKPRREVSLEEVSIDIFRKQNGWWYKRTFEIKPGQPIGQIMNMPSPELAERNTRGTGEAAAVVEVDFSTNVILVDILPPTGYWYQRGNQMLRQESATLVLRDKQGRVFQLPMEKLCWPADVADVQSMVNRVYREQERELAERLREARR